MFSFLRLAPKTNATTASGAFEAQNNEESPVPSAPPVIQDFYVNSTWAGPTSLFSFNVSSSSGDLASATLSTNITSPTFTNDTVSISGSVAWANFTKTLPSSNCIVAFDFWVFDADASLYATTGLRLLKVYAYNGMAGAWNTPFVSLGSALQSVDSANNWRGVSVYDQYILGRNSTSLEAMIDSYDASHDWTNVLYWSAVCNKLNITRQQAIKDALGNYTMVGALPFTGNGYSGPAFITESKWALYGFWYANNSWANASMAKWNITAAYNFFNCSVYNSGYPVLWIYSDGSTWSAKRYYDECACTIECYLIFYKLLNVTGALNDALYWWNWTNANLWSSDGTHYEYSTSWYGYECEAAFFLKIISILKYYDMSLQNWTNVLTDIGNRFLSSEWNSKQWVDGTTGKTTYVVVHHYPGNNQRRLENTLGAWQALEGVYLQLNSTYEEDMVDMLYGNQATEPAWALLLRPEGSLFDSTTNTFRQMSNAPLTADATAMAEILMFILGIVPQTTTIAFPLEELNYEYLRDINPTVFNLNTRNRTITVPVDDAGTMIFQYGVSPITCVFNQSGVWQITFTNSWNNVASVTFQSALPDSLVYFSQIYAEPLCSSLGTSGNLPGRSSLFSAYWTDRAQNVNVTGFIFGSNNTGTWVNETWNSDQNLGWGTPSAWGNITKTLNCTGSAVIQWQEWANDSDGVWGTTGPQTLQTLPVPSVPPSVNDFYVNSTWAGQPCLFSFNVSDPSNQLDHVVFGCNITGSFVNDGNTSLSGGSSWQWVNYTKTLPASNCVVSFNFSVWNINTTIYNTTGLRYMKVYAYNSTQGAWNTPFVSLGSAIQTVENANYLASNNWTGIDPYYTTVLNQQNGSTTTYLSNMIDGLDNRTEVYSYCNNASGSFWSNASYSYDNNLLTAATMYFTPEAYMYGSSASGSGWTNPSYVYDNDISTYASYTFPSFGWSTPLILSLSSVTFGQKIQYAAGVSSSNVNNMTIDIANATGSWVNVNYTTPNFSSSYVNISFTQSDYTAIKFTFHSIVEGVLAYVYEAQGLNTYNLGWGNPLVLNMSQNTVSSKIHYLVSSSTSNITSMKIEVANSSGSWFSAFNGAPSWGSYANTSVYSSVLLQNTFTAMRISFYSSGIGIASVYEAQAVNVTTYSIDSTNIIYWSAICDKLGITRQQAIIDALNNYTMAGSLPYTGVDLDGAPVFCTEAKWALYGYWYANNSWANASMTKWNITAAYGLFNNSLYNHEPGLWIYSDGSVVSFMRYYDECACTIECYLIFYTMLNVTGALNDALHWWNWTNTNLWRTGTHYEYSTTYFGYECEASFFLKIISELKYYDSSLPSWSNVLTDIGNRFLGSEWNSKQWLDGTYYWPTTTYVVTHLWNDYVYGDSNPQRRLQNTLGAWQALEGVYLQLNSIYEQNMVDMLYGNQATEPAWALLLTPQAGLFNSTANMFSFSSATGIYNFANDQNATAQAEILMFMMGIVPQTTTVAFPLEELGYEYTNDINPTALNMNVSSRTLTVSVNSAGTLTFQYGVSPITQTFNSSGVFRIVFSDSWNNIVNVTLVSSLPNNAIYFSQLNAPAATEPTHGGGGRPAYVC